MAYPLRFFGLGVAAVAAVVVLAGPSRAAACYTPPCWSESGWTSFQPLNSSPIPTDGMLLLLGDTTDLAGKGSPTIDLTVTLDGAPVPGSLKYPADGVLGWKPDAPLTPGATYQVSGTVELYVANVRSCDPTSEPFDFSFTADVGPMVPLMAPEVNVVVTKWVLEDADLNALVCCDGAAPTLEVMDCTGLPYIHWEQGRCAETKGTGRISVKFEITDAYPSPTATLIDYVVVVDGEAQDNLSVTREAPFCARVVVQNLVDGAELATPEQCFGEADDFGTKEIDPAEGLAECVGPAQTCEPDRSGDAWDLGKCTPAPGGGGGTDTGTTTSGGESEGTGTGTGGDSTGTGGATTTAGAGSEGEGCGCAADDRGSWIAALGLLGLLRRRRSR